MIHEETSYGWIVEKWIEKGTHLVTQRKIQIILDLSVVDFQSLSKVLVFEHIYIYRTQSIYITKHIRCNERVFILGINSGFIHLLAKKIRNQNPFCKNMRLE